MIRQQTIDLLINIGLKLRQVQALLPLFGTDSWQAFLALVRDDENRKLRALCNLSATEQESTILRAEIWTLRWLLRLAEFKRDELEKLATQAKGLHERVEKVHTRGHDRDNPEAQGLLDEARNLQRLLEGIEQTT